MTEGRMREILAESGALLTGHFMLASGLHSDTYLQCAKVLQHPAIAKEVAAALIEKLDGAEIHSVCGPALGGVVIGFELARQLGAKAIFTERKDGLMMLHRGFAVEPGERILIAEDVVTTGGSVLETIEILLEQGAEIVAVTCLVDRSGGKDLRYPCLSLLEMDPPTWEQDRCPLCERGVGVVKPGGSLRKGI